MKESTKFMFIMGLWITISITFSYISNIAGGFSTGILILKALFGLGLTVYIWMYGDDKKENFLAMLLVVTLCIGIVSMFIILKTVQDLYIK